MLEEWPVKILKVSLYLDSFDVVGLIIHWYVINSLSSFVTQNEKKDLTKFVWCLFTLGGLPSVVKNF